MSDSNENEMMVPVKDFKELEELYQQEIKSLEKRIEKSAGELKALQDQFDAMRSERQQEIRALNDSLATEQRFKQEGLEREARLRREIDDSGKDRAALQDKLDAAQTELGEVGEWAKELQVEVGGFAVLQREFGKTKAYELAALQRRCEDAQDECVAAREETAVLQDRFTESENRRDSLERQLAAALEREGRLQEQLKGAQREMQSLRSRFSGDLPESPGGNDSRGDLLGRNDIGGIFYELTQIPGVLVNLRFDAPEQVEVDEERLPSRWLRGIWDLTGIPLACVLDERFRRAIGLPGIMIESGSVSNNSWSFKGNVYAVQQQ